MKHIIAVNGSPRRGWNTDALVREAERGARESGAEVEHIDLFGLEPYTGCVSCFGCKTPASLGRCVHRDGLAPVLEKLRSADGLILGSPIYLNEVTASVRALYERLGFQYITYKREPDSYCERAMPVVLIFTCNCPEASFLATGYDRLFEGYRQAMERFFGSAKVLVSSETWQVNDYERWDWDRFDVPEKKARRETVFPMDMAAAFKLGAELV